MKISILFIIFNSFIFNALIAQSKIDTLLVKKLMNESIDQKLVFGSAITISKPTEQFTYEAGNFNKNQQKMR